MDDSDEFRVKAFVYEVAQMIALQREYFDQKTNVALGAAMRQERRVARLLARLPAWMLEAPEVLTVKQGELSL